MSSFKNLEMAYAVSVHPHITVKKSLFQTKVIYTPTESPVRPIIQEYTPTMPTDKLLAELKQKGAPASGSNGHYHLEACLSDDRQFCALQMFRYADFSYNAIGEPRFYEGDEAKTVAQIL